MTAPTGAAFTKKEKSYSIKTGSEEMKLQGFIFGGLNNLASTNTLKSIVKFSQK